MPSFKEAFFPTVCAIASTAYYFLKPIIMPEEQSIPVTLHLQAIEVVKKTIPPPEIKIVEVEIPIPVNTVKLYLTPLTYAFLFLPLLVLLLGLGYKRVYKKLPKIITKPTHVVHTLVSTIPIFEWLSFLLASLDPYDYLPTVIDSCFDYLHIGLGDRILLIIAAYIALLLVYHTASNEKLELQERATTAEEALHTMTERAAELEKANELANSKVNSMEEESDKAKMLQLQLENRIKSLEEDVTISNGRISELETADETAKSTIATMREASRNADNLKLELEGRINALEADLSTSTQLVTALRKEKQLAEDKNTKLKEDADDQKVALEERVRELLEEVNLSFFQVTVLTEEKGAAEEGQSQLKEQTVILEDTVKKLEADADIAAKQINSLMGEKGDIEAQKVRIEEEKVRLEGEVSSSMFRVEELEKDKELRKASLDIANAEKASVEEALDRCQTILDFTCKRIEFAGGELTALEDAKTELDEQVKKLREENGDAMNRVAKMEGEKKSLEEEKATLETERAFLQGKVKASEEFLSSQTKTTSPEVAAGEIASLQAELKTTRAELQAAKVEADYSNRNANGTNQKVTKLASQLRDLQAGKTDDMVKHLESEVYRLEKVQVAASRQGQDLQQARAKLNDYHSLLVKIFEGEVTAEEARKTADTNGWLVDPVVPPTQVKTKTRGRGRRGKPPRKLGDSTPKPGDDEDEDESNDTAILAPKANGNADTDGSDRDLTGATY